MSLRVLIADDEMPARIRLRNLVERHGGCQVVAEASNGRQALDACREHRPDIALLDIRMPGMDGLEAARRIAELPTPPSVVFTTAYDHHALEAFEADAVDYLLKPVRLERLAQALEKAQRVRAGLNGSSEPPTRTHISVQHRGALRLIPIEEIIYFQAEQKYVTVRHLGGEALIEESLKSLEKELGGRFVRIHRNALVAASRLAGMRRSADGRHVALLRDCDEELEISRRMAPEVRRFLTGKQEGVRSPSRSEG